MRLMSRMTIEHQDHDDNHANDKPWPRRIADSAIHSPVALIWLERLTDELHPVLLAKRLPFVQTYSERQRLSGKTPPHRSCRLMHHNQAGDPLASLDEGAASRRAARIENRPVLVAACPLRPENLNSPTRTKNHSSQSV